MNDAEKINEIRKIMAAVLMILSKALQEPKPNDLPSRGQLLVDIIMRITKVLNPEPGDDDA